MIGEEPTRRLSSVITTAHVAIKIKGETLAFITSMCILTLLSFVGNLFVLIVILISKHIRSKPSAIYIINGAISNFLFIVIVEGTVVLNAIMNTDEPEKHYVVCRIYDSYFAFNSFVVTFTIVVLALDKYYAILKPFWYRQHSTTRNALTITVLSWIIAAIFSVPKFLTLRSDHGTRLCRIQSVRRTIELVSEVVHLVVVFLIPLLVLFAVYGRLVHRLWFSKQDSNSRGTDVALLKSRRKLTKLSLTVTVLFVLCWTPHSVETVWWCLGFERTVVTEWFKVYASMFVFGYSAISPVVYAFYNEATLRASKRILCCLRCKQCWKARSAEVVPAVHRNDEESRNIPLTVTPVNHAVNEPRGQAVSKE